MDREKLQKALTEYSKISDAAWAEYNKIRDAAWAEYDKISGTAWAEYDKISDAAWTECNKICDAAQAEYDKICDAAQAEYDKICDAAWEGVAEAVEDPLVSWIIKECTERRPEAIEILGMLPASLSELDEYASNAGWCREWTGFRTKALKAGVITGGG